MPETSMRPEPDRTVLITGAAGGLGRAVAAEARRRGWRVRAMVRGAPPAAWRDDPGVEIVAVDLAAPEARAALDGALVGARAVVHAAGRLSGGDAQHARDTVGPTKTLLAALAALKAPPALALISSLSVYGYAAMPTWAALDETTPLEPDPQLRDAYARAKLAQERLAMRAAQEDGLTVRALRVGALVAPERLGAARLGFSLGPALLIVGGSTPIPAIATTDCAAAVMAAVETPPGRSDLPVFSGGGFEAINLVAPDPPDQAALAQVLRRAGRVRLVLRLPARPLRLAAQAFALVGAFLPGLARRLPTPLRLEAFDARFKPLRFPAARMEDRLGARCTPALAALGAGS